MQIANFLILQAPQQYEILQAIFAKKGYEFYTLENKLNIIGLRQNISLDRKADNDAFTDFIFVCLNYADANFCIKYNATTVPSLIEETNPTFAEAQQNGVAILKEGQYVDSWQIGMLNAGQWSHKCLIQCKEIDIYRDKSRSGKIDLLNCEITRGLYDICIHNSCGWGNSGHVGYSSAGCQVIQNEYEFNNRFMQMCYNVAQCAKQQYFTYTLLTEDDLNLYEN